MAQTDLLSIENEFIKVIINNQTLDQGRFAMETVKGDPQNKLDDFQPLIYGRPKPWTSYTTILIDGTSYVFGGKTQKRAGKSAQYGEILSQRVENNNLITTTVFNQGIIVTQTLELFRNPSTKVKDCALISYEIKNIDASPHKIGIRIMLDTMLGKNDGAPFRIGDKAIEAEKEFLGTHILNYWQAFDHLTDPSIIAQGILRLPEEGIFPPNRVYLVNWGTLADNPWQFTYQENRSFIREGETEKDTSLALYWDPQSIAPNKSLSVKTIYGLGGVSLSSGALSLGLTAPAEMYATSKSEILIIGYLLNSSGYDALNTVVQFDIPTEFKLLQGQSEYQIGTFNAGESIQIPITLEINKPIPGDKKITLSIKSDTLEKNTLTRVITLLSPPKIEMNLTTSKEYSPSYNSYIPIYLSLKNNGKYSIPSINAMINYPTKNLELPFFEYPTKSIPLLKRGQTVTLNWQCQVKEPTETLKISSKINSSVTIPELKTITIKKQELMPKLILEPSQTKLKPNQFFYIWITIQNPGKIQEKDVYLEFDSQSVKYIKTSPELWLIKKGLTEKLHQEQNQIVLDSVEDTNTSLEKRLCKVHFKTIKEGTLTFYLKQNERILEQIQVIVE